MILRIIPILFIPILLAARYQTTSEKNQVDQSTATAATTTEPAHDPEGVKPPDGFQWKIWAKEPLVADPVAFTVLNDGSLMVVESERQDRGVEDNRYSPWWLMEDLRAVTVEERLAIYTKYADKRVNGMDWYTKYADRVKHVTDKSGGGVADTAVNFSGELREPLEDRKSVV